MAIALAILVVVGGSIGIVAYDKATAIDRSTPDVAAERFLHAVIVVRDEATVGLYICQSWSASEAIEVAGLPSNPALQVNWGDTSLTQNGTSAVADIRVVLRIPAGNGAFYRDIQPWHLTLVNESGWRVCGLTRGPSINE